QVADKLDAFTKKLRGFAPANARPSAPITLELLSQLENVFDAVQHVDAAPTPALNAAGADIQGRAKEVMERWQAFVSQEIPALNRDLEAAGLARLPD
ncbi:MAG: hypothetical protein QOD12_545, partial [Verrucomicrobiota bacterium]